MITNEKEKIKKMIEFLTKAETTLDDLMKDFDNFNFTKSRRDAIIISRNNLIVLKTYLEGELE